MSVGKHALVVLVGVIFAATGMGGIAEAQPSARITLVKDRQPAATIVVAENATCSARFAALELQFHLKKMTGAVLPVITADNTVKGTRILVGESRATAALNLRDKPFGPQEYLIKFLPETVVLMGKDSNRRSKVKYAENNQVHYATWPDFFEEQGTCYAAYDFLERFCGVRWFRPGELGMVCPQTATLTVSGGDIRRSPVFKYRNPYPLLVSLDSYDQRAGLWNWAGRAKKDQPQLERVKALAYPEMKGKSIQAKRGMISLYLHRARLGGEPYAGGHSFYGFYDRFWKQNPKRPDVFEAERPEWFAKGYGKKPSPIKTEGEKTRKTYYEKPPQMCFTNPEFTKQVVQDARDYFDGKGKKVQAQAAGDYFGLEPMDNRLYCKCPDCQKQIPPDAVRGKGQYSNDRASDYLFGFANRVAREIRKTHPDKFISSLAYMEHAWPPVREKLEPNVSVSFCLHARMVYSPKTQENDRRLLKAWADYAKGNRLQVYLYYLFPAYSAVLANFNCFPGFFAHSIDKSFKLYHQYGVRGAFFEGFDHDVEAYVTCKLMDDPTRNIDNLLNEYFTGMYGNAAEPMKQFYLTVERIYSDPANYPEDAGHQTAQIAWEHLGTAKRMATLGKLIEGAHAAAKTDTEKARVALFDQQVWKYMTTGRQRYIQRTKTPTPSVTAPKVKEAGGDAAKVDWRKATVISKWHKVKGGPADRKLEARLAHDGRFLYLQFTEWVDPGTLKINHANVCNDDWELFFARQRAKPYRQFGWGPTGKSFSIAWGEVAGKSRSTWDNGVKVMSDISAPDRWTTRAAFPLEKLLPGGVKPGDKFYMNFIRVWNVSHKWHQNTWSPLGGVHQLDRLGEITLEK